jgi:hypothetical protein
MQKMSVVQSLHDGLLSSIAGVQSKADHGKRPLLAAPGTQLTHCSFAPPRSGQLEGRTVRERAAPG